MNICANYTNRVFVSEAYCDTTPNFSKTRKSGINLFFVVVFYVLEIQNDHLTDLDAQ